MKNEFLPAVRRKNPKIIATRILVIIMLFANLSFIWINSSKTAKESTETSNSVTHSVAKHVVEDYEDLSPKEQKAKVKELNPKVRTAAHMIEYVPLGALIFLLIISIYDVSEKLGAKKKLMLILLSVFLALVFSVSDEIHQIFVKGRSFELKDIAMDSLGMFLGYSLFAGIFSVYNSIKIKNTDV